MIVTLIFCEGNDPAHRTMERLDDIRSSRASPGKLTETQRKKGCQYMRKNKLTYAVILVVAIYSTDKLYTSWNKMCMADQAIPNELCAHHLAVSNGKSFGEYSCDETGHYIYEKQYTWASCDAELLDLCRQVMIDEVIKEKELEQAQEQHGRRIESPGSSGGYVTFYDASQQLSSSHKDAALIECLKQNESKLSRECTQAVDFYEHLDKTRRENRIDDILRLPTKILTRIGDVVSILIVKPLVFIIRGVRC